MLPGSLIVAVATLLASAYDVVFRSVSRSKFVRIALTIYVVLFVIARLRYREWFR